MKNYLLMGLVALGIISTSCSNDEFEGDSLSNGEGTITVRLEGSNSTRSLLPNTKDSKINDFQVYVFSWNSGVLEDSKSGNLNGATIFEKLSTANSKRVVVLANLGTYPVVTNYAQLSAAANKINLDKQTPELAEEKGFVMSGESPFAVVLNPNQIVQEDINLYRAVAKISLETITIVPEEGYDIDKLEILSVAAQRVTPEVTLAPITSYYDTYHYGGFTSANNQLELRDYLADELTFEDAQLKANKEYKLGNYFLVFPNENKEDCTLLTIKAKYNGEIIYYPVKVNYQEGSQNTTGKFVQSNKHYKLNITVKKIGDGTTDPEVPPTDGDLEVTITVENWDVVTQNEEW